MIKLYKIFCLAYNTADMDIVDMADCQNATGFHFRILKIQI